MRRESHVRICLRGRVRSPSATHLTVGTVFLARLYVLFFIEVDRRPVQMAGVTRHLNGAGCTPIGSTPIGGCAMRSGSTSTNESAGRSAGCRPPWCPAVDADGDPRGNGEVAEVTGLLRDDPAGDQMTGWPADMRLILRRERPHPGAQLSVFEQYEGFRFQVTATNLPTGQIPFLEACHRVQARVVSTVRCAKGTGVRRLQSQKFTINSVWCVTVGIAHDLLAWS